MMKNLLVLLIALTLLSCKKEPLYGPLNLKNGQEVELLINANYGAENDILLKMPEKVSAGAPLSNFEEREPGYIYRVKAKFRNDDNPPADGPSQEFEFVKVLSKEQYKGNEPFKIQIITSYVPGGPVIRLGRQGNDYFFIPGKLQFTFADNIIKSQLEEIMQNADAIRANWPKATQPKWKSITATVIHDPNKFGKAYLVQKLDFVQ